MPASSRSIVFVCKVVNSQIVANAAGCSLFHNFHFTTGQPVQQSLLQFQNVSFLGNDCSSQGCPFGVPNIYGVGLYSFGTNAGS